MDREQISLAGQVQGTESNPGHAQVAAFNPCAPWTRHFRSDPGGRCRVRGQIGGGAFLYAALALAFLPEPDLQEIRSIRSWPILMGGPSEWA